LNNHISDNFENQTYIQQVKTIYSGRIIGSVVGSSYQDRCQSSLALKSSTVAADGAFHPLVDLGTSNIPTKTFYSVPDLSLCLGVLKHRAPFGALGNI
jgi:hypothetical protein